MKLPTLILIIVVLSSCSEVFKFDVKNNTQSVLDIIVVSSEFKLQKDTFWNETDSAFVLGKWIEVDYLKPKNRFMISKAEKLENVNETDRSKIWIPNDLPNFYDVQEIKTSKAIEITFKLEPGENLELLTYIGSKRFRYNCLMPIDTIIIKNTNPPDTFEIALKGYHAIKSMRDFPNDDIGTYTITIN